MPSCPPRPRFEPPLHAYPRRFMAAVPVADPARRHIGRTLQTCEIPSASHPVGYEPDVQPLVEVGPGHFVARHPTGGDF